MLFSFSIVLLTDRGLAVTGSFSLLTLGSLGGLAGDGTLAFFLVLTKSSSLSSDHLDHGDVHRDYFLFIFRLGR
jgi:hypothetical protein